MRARRSTQWDPWPTVVLWGAWLLAPGSLALATLVVWGSEASSESYLTAGFVAGMFTFTAHIVGGLYGLILLMTPGPHRAHFEYRALIAYWVVIAVLVAVVFSPFADRSRLEYVVFAFALIANAITLSAFSAGIVRLVRWLARRHKS